MCNILKQIFLIYLKQFRLTIYLIIGIFLFFCLFLAYDVRFMSDKEVLACLTRIYDREFIVQSTHRLNEAERAENVWRVKVYDVVPVDEPERHFWAFNIVKAESGGIFAASDGLRDTLSAEIMLATFAERAAQSGLAYELTYDSYPCQASTGYYSGINVNIELTAVDNWPAMYELVAASARDTLAQLPLGYDYAIGLDFVFIYREPDWPKDKFYPLWVMPFDFDTKEPLSVADIQAEVEEKLLWYRDNYDIWKKYQ